MRTIINNKGIIEYAYDPNQKLDWSVEVRFDMSHLLPNSNRLLGR